MGQWIFERVRATDADLLDFSNTVEIKNTGCIGLLCTNETKYINIYIYTRIIKL